MVPGEGCAIRLYMFLIIAFSSFLNSITSFFLAISKNQYTQTTLNISCFISGVTPTMKFPIKQFKVFKS